MSDSSNLQRIKRKLKKLSEERKIDYNMVVTEYLLECVVRRLVTAKDLASKATFKGGYVCVRVYNSPRYTTDVDLTIRGISADKAVAKSISLIEQQADDGAWFQHQEVVDLLTQGEYGGMRIVTRGGLGTPPKDAKRSQIFHIDIGINDAISPPPIETISNSLAGIGSFNWMVYSVETVVAEKLHTMIDRGSENSRSRDVFDINLLIDQCDKATLKSSIAATFSHRETSLPQSMSVALTTLDRTVMSRGWRKVMENAATDKSFDETFEEMLLKLKTLDF